MQALVYHNPRCGKSRTVLSILEEKGIPFEVKEYLKETLTIKELKGLSKLLGLKFPEMMRTKEEVYVDLKLATKKLNEDEWAKILTENPILLERPIVIWKEKAIIARPSEKVLDIL